MGSYFALSITFPIILWQHMNAQQIQKDEDVTIRLAQACNEIKLKSPRHVTRWVVFDVQYPLKGRQIVCNDAKAMFVPMKQVEEYSKNRGGRS